MARLHAERMTDLLRSIAAGEFAPGEKLPREVDLASRLGVSRAVVRSAIQGLVDRDVITVKHGSGQTVRPPAEWNVLDLDVLDAVVRFGDARDLVLEVLEARRLVEVPAVGLAAERASTADVAALRELAETMQRTARSRPRQPEEDPFADAEVTLHRRLGLATENRPLARSLASLHHASRAAGVGSTRRQATAEERAELVDAIERRDADAARAAAERHLRALIEAARKPRPRRR
jgi:GntR family transcriptional repressor for pyruvate dehydrogenase complex